MKDVSKRTIEDLLTFIYRGEVNVNQSDLVVFLETAKALKIKGLIDESFTQAFDVRTPASNWSSLAPQNGFQYQSSQTVIVKNVANSVAGRSNYHQVSTNVRQNDFGNCEMSQNSYGSDISHGDDCRNDQRINNDESTMDQTYDVPSDLEWGTKHGHNQRETEMVDLKAKRTKPFFGK